MRLIFKHKTLILKFVWIIIATYFYLERICFQIGSKNLEYLWARLKCINLVTFQEHEYCFCWKTNDWKNKASGMFLVCLKFSPENASTLWFIIARILLTIQIWLMKIWKNPNIQNTLFFSILCLILSQFHNFFSWICC